MKIYLAGPMRFREDRNKPEFDRIAYILRTGGHEVFNPAVYVATQDDTTVEGCREIFAADAAWLCKYADVVVLLPGWEISKGAKAEAALAVAIGIPIQEWEDIWQNSADQEHAQKGGKPPQIGILLRGASVG